MVHNPKQYIDGYVRNIYRSDERSNKLPETSTHRIFSKMGLYSIARNSGNEKEWVEVCECFQSLRFPMLDLNISVLSTEASGWSSMRCHRRCSSP